MSISDLAGLRRKLAAAQAKGIVNCGRAASTAEAWSRNRAIEDIEATLATFGVSLREFARLCAKDLATIQDWLSDGRKRLPLWAIYRLPREPRLYLINRLLDGVDDAPPPSLTGTER